MLCPEVINFEAPRSTVNIKKTNNIQEALDTLKNYHFNHLISIVLPDTLQVPSAITDTLIEDCEYYKVYKLKLDELVSKDFIENFVKEGEVGLLSTDNWIDLNDCYCLTPTANLILSLKKETYQTFGIEGVISHFHKSTKERYVVNVDLKTIKYGSKLHERLRTCLNKLNDVNVIINWHPYNENVCPSSIAKYFSDNHTIKLCKPRHDTFISYCSKVPSINFEDIDDDDCGDVVEWLGMISLGANLDSDDYLSTYECPEPSLDLGQARVITWKGFYTNVHLSNVLSKLQVFTKGRDVWSSMYVQGFSDVPVQINSLKEQHYYTNGDNSLCLLINPNEKCILYTSGVTNKRY